MPKTRAFAAKLWLEGLQLRWYGGFHSLLFLTMPRLDLISVNLSFRAKINIHMG